MRAMRAPLAEVSLLLLLLASAIACRREEPIPPAPTPAPSPAAAAAEPATAPAAGDETTAGDDETPAEGLAEPTDEEPPAGAIGK
jgi:hypothetical protein